MTEMLARILALIEAGEVRISAHGYDELQADGIQVREVMAGIARAETIEIYPNYHKGPCILVMQRDQHDRPIHVVWGIPKGTTTPAVLVTAYRPDSNLWADDFMRRRR